MKKKFHIIYLLIIIACRYHLSGTDTNGQYYYYLKNTRGDIVKIVDSTGSVVAKYNYDAWGYCFVTGPNGESLTSSHIGRVNPFRYRGYYYDSETYLYYINSRYYDPYIGRFISADGFVSTGQDITGYNLFAYFLIIHSFLLSLHHIITKV